MNACPWLLPQGHQSLCGVSFSVAFFCKSCEHAVCLTKHLILRERVRAGDRSGLCAPGGTVQVVHQKDQSLNLWTLGVASVLWKTDVSPTKFMDTPTLHLYKQCHWREEVEDEKKRSISTLSFIPPNMLFLHFYIGYLGQQHNFIEKRRCFPSNYAVLYFMRQKTCWDTHKSVISMSLLTSVYWNELLLRKGGTFLLVQPHKRTESVKATRCWWNIIQDPTCSTRQSETERGQIQEIKLLSLSQLFLVCLGFLGSNNLTKCPFAE